MRSLFIKELQEMWSLIAFSALVFALLTAAHLSIQVPLRTYKDALQYLNEDQLILCCLAAFSAGHGRFGHELEQGTLGFLEGLPISRTRIFVVKSAAVAVPVICMWLAMLLSKWIALALYPQANAISLVPMMAALGVQLGALLLLHAALGMALSWFGRVAWQALIIVALSMIVAQVFLPGLIPYYPLLYNGVTVDLVQGWPTFPWLPVALWVLGGMAGLATACGLFLGPGDRIVTGRGWVKWVAQILIFGPVIGLMGLLIALSVFASAFSLPSLVQRTERTETEHFRILYAQQDGPSARELIAEAEGTRLAIAAAFDHEGPERLDIEMTGGSEHLQGVFIPGKVQIRPDGDVGTLAHELAHAWSYSKSEGSLHGLPGWGFYEEGLASYMEGLVGDPTTQASRPSRGQPKSDWMLIPNPDLHQRRYNPDDQYPLGMAWVEAVFELAGPDGLICIHRSATETLKGERDVIPWWAEILSSCDIEMKPFIEAYRGALAQPGVPHSHEPFAKLEADGSGTVQLWPVVDSDNPILACTARRDSRTPRTQYVTTHVTRGEPCVLDTWLISQDDFQLMVGEVKDDQTTAMGPWRDMSR